MAGWKVGGLEEGKGGKRNGCLSEAGFTRFKDFQEWKAGRRKGKIRRNIQEKTPSIAAVGCCVFRAIFLAYFLYILKFGQFPVAITY